MGNAITRLTAARFDGPQALYTEAVRLLSERPALPDDLAGLVARLLEASADARDAFAEQWADAQYTGERPDLEPITAELAVEQIEDAADAIEAMAAENARLAAREPMCAAVKPLEWTVRHGQYEHLQAEGPFPNRSPLPDYIIGSNDGKTEWYWCNFGEWNNSPLPSEDAAKAAAQADFKARILSAITLRPEAEVRAEAWAAALEAAADEQRRKADHWMKRAHEIGTGDGRHPADGRVAGHLSAEASIRAMITDDARAALDRLKAEAKAEGMRIGAAREKMRALTEWLNEDEDNGELLMASLDGDTIETLRAILASIQEVCK